MKKGKGPPRKLVVELLINIKQTCVPIHFSIKPLH